MENGIGGDYGLIVDLGCANIKAGKAGEHFPPLVFDSWLGKPRFRKLSGLETKDLIVDPPAEVKGLYKLIRPVERGFVSKKNAELLFAKVWRDLAPKYGVNSVLVTDPPFSPLNQREDIANILFDNHKVDRLFLGLQGVLSLYGTGRTSGVLLESGDGITQIVPIYCGYKLNYSVEKVNFAGKDIARRLKLLLQKKGIMINCSNEDYLYEKIKREVCELNLVLPLLPGITDDVRSEEGPALPHQRFNYELPDGEIISIGQERHLAPEILFDPAHGQYEFTGLHHFLSNTIKKLDMDLRNVMFQNIVLSGGNTMIPGFASRLGTELKPLMHENTRMMITANDCDRSLLAWQGGSALSQLTAFNSLWITKKELQESGNRIFLSKSF